jgi:hypothetical protein
MMVNYDYWYSQAVRASKIVGWLPSVIMSQWIVETAHFSSNNFVNNRNIAGQTWTANCGYPMGTARPLKEGGHYIKYPDAVIGYCDFINRNARYKEVKKFTTPEEQFRAIKLAGWATDPNYVKTLMSVCKWCVTHNIFKEVEKPRNKYTSLVDYLKANHKASDFISRRKLAESKGIRNYTGTATENIKLLNMLQG